MICVNVQTAPLNGLKQPVSGVLNKDNNFKKQSKTLPIDLNDLPDYFKGFILMP